MIATMRPGRWLCLVSFALCVGPGCRSNRSNETPAAGSAAETVDTTGGLGIAAPEATAPITDETLVGEVDPQAPPLVECPADTEDPRDIVMLLEAAQSAYDRGEFDIAYACADVVADIMPSSVDAHHLRASSLAALGRFSLAQVAFTMALALDPDDPYTLLAAADFYVNILQPRSRDALLVGVEFARRGRLRSAARRRGPRTVRAQLALVEAQGLNDMGQPDEALDRAAEALRMQPELIDATYERALALFNLCRFEASLAAFKDVLAIDPDDPYAHHHAGLLLERLGETKEAQEHFDSARMLSPVDFSPTVQMSKEEFREVVNAVLGELAPELRAKVDSVPIEIVDYPDLEDLLSVDPPFPPTILGLYRGMPHGIPIPVEYEGQEVPPRAIVLYRMNLARAVRTADELNVQIRRTLLHEIGHLNGLDEDDLRRRGLD